MTRQIVVATHSGVFHADDVFAMALVQFVLRRNGVQVVPVRTREESVIADADLVLDVGNVFDPESGRFDHHQWTFLEDAVCHTLRERVNGENVESTFSKATFGLVWEHYHEAAINEVVIATLNIEGIDWKLFGKNREEIYSKVKDGVDRYLVMGIDASDVGFRRSDPMFKTVSQIISGFNPEWYESPKAEDYDAAFERAVEWAEDFLFQQIRRELCSVLSRDYGQLAAPIVDRGELVDGTILVLDQFAPWAGVVAQRDYREDLEFVIHPDNGTWMIWQIPVDESGAFKAGSFTGRHQLPAEWAGKRNEELAALTGVEDAVFCHGGRFCGGAGSREGAIAMARLALKA